MTPRDAPVLGTFCVAEVQQRCANRRPTLRCARYLQRGCGRSECVLSYAMQGKAMQVLRNAAQLGGGDGPTALPAQQAMSPTAPTATTQIESAIYTRVPPACSARSVLEYGLPVPCGWVCRSLGVCVLPVATATASVYPIAGRRPPTWPRACLRTQPVEARSSASCTRSRETPTERRANQRAAPSALRSLCERNMQPRRRR